MLFVIVIERNGSEEPNKQQTTPETTNRQHAITDNKQQATTTNNKRPSTLKMFRFCVSLSSLSQLVLQTKRLKQEAPDTKQQPTSNNLEAKGDDGIGGRTRACDIEIDI